MIKTFAILFFIFVSDTANSQVSDSTDSLKCSRVLRDLSYFWKLDSLANNGFREANRKKLMACASDTISKDFLLKQLGTPNKLWVNNHVIEYVYFYHDYNAIQKDQDYDFPKSVGISASNSRKEITI